MTSEPSPRWRCWPPTLEQPWGPDMRGPEECRRFAEECRRLAMQMPSHQVTLLNMAAAWDACAIEYEKKAQRPSEASEPA